MKKVLFLLFLLAVLPLTGRAVTAQEAIIDAETNSAAAWAAAEGRIDVQVEFLLSRGEYYLSKFKQLTDWETTIIAYNRMEAGAAKDAEKTRIDGLITSYSSILTTAETWFTASEAVGWTSPSYEKKLVEHRQLITDVGAF